MVYPVCGAYVTGSNRGLKTINHNVQIEFMLNVQASKGSFNHLAVNKLYGEGGIEINFCGTSADTFARANCQKTDAFVALRNDLTDGHLIRATVEACQAFSIRQVRAAVCLPIHMCLLRTESAVESNIPLRKISSHPAALEQVEMWRAKKGVDAIPEPAGTSEAARKLVASGDNSLGVIGPESLAKVYSLVVVERNIQNRPDNTTLFGQLAVSQRKTRISYADATEELRKVIEQIQRHLAGKETCFIESEESLLASDNTVL